MSKPILNLKRTIMEKSKPYDLVVYIGRFQPPHIGHFDVIRQAREKAVNVLILLGSANASRNLRNPFSVEERKQMILGELESTEHLFVDAIDDTPYNDTVWCSDVQSAVTTWVNDNFDGDNFASVAVIGHSKDETSFYLRLFPQWDVIDATPLLGENGQVISSTETREVLFDPNGLHGINDAPNLTPSVKNFLRLPTRLTDPYRDEAPVFEIMRNEMRHVQNYKRSWAAAPYPPTFVTVDAVVVQSGHVLLVKRAAEPGRGLWALPGGFVNQNERLLDACLRELREETRLKVPEPVLRGSITNTGQFDDPKRSLRGRTITTAWLFVLTPVGDMTLPKVKGSDDAEEARWWPLNQVVGGMMYEDHLHILKSLINHKL
jgi:bifunctional NMN adenylyltransferase/nudix hydrolase